jgi:hypothetical protein
MQKRNFIQIFGYLSTLIANSMLKQCSLKATLFHSMPCCRCAENFQIIPGKDTKQTSKKQRF